MKTLHAFLCVIFVALIPSIGMAAPPLFTGSVDVPLTGSLTLDGVSPGQCLAVTPGGIVVGVLCGAGSVTLVTGSGNIVSSGGSTPNITTVASPTFTSVTATSITASGLTSGNCVQAGVGGILTTIVGACGVSGGTVTSVTASAHAASSGGTAPNITTDGTNANTASTLVARDGSGNFLASNVTLSGALSTAQIFNVLSPTYNAVCNGSTPDQAHIQAAITAAAGNGTVLIPAGVVCMIDAPGLTVPSNSSIEIEGTLKLYAANANTLLYINPSTTNIHIFGGGILDGNSANATGPGLSSQSSSSNILINGNLTIQNVAHFPLSLAGTHVHLSGMTLAANTGAAAPGFQGPCTDCWADHITSSASDSAFAFYGGVIGGGITNSKIVSAPNYGITVLNDQFSTSPNKNILILGNVCTTTSAGPCVFVGDGPGTTNMAQQSGISIIGNNLSGASQGGISLSNVVGTTVSGNTIHGDAAGQNGITLTANEATSASYLVNINGNQIYDEGTSGSHGNGIYLATTSTSVSVSGNQFYDDRGGSAGMACGITGTPGTNTSLLGNSSLGMLTAGNCATGGAATDLLTMNPLLITAGTTNALASGNGYLQTGSTVGQNLIQDFNSIQARSNGSANTLELNINGGAILLGPSASVSAAGAVSGSSVTSNGAFVTPMYRSSGSAAGGSPHTVQDQVLAASASTAVTLSGSAAFASAATYTCNVIDVTSSVVVTTNVAIVNSSTFQFTSSNGHYYNYTCTGF